MIDAVELESFYDLGLHSGLQKVKIFCTHSIVKFSINPDKIVYAVETLDFVEANSDSVLQNNCSRETTLLVLSFGGKAELFACVSKLMSQCFPVLVCL